MGHGEKAAAYKFVILIGTVSLFADMTYESARSINGAYLQILGANAATVGFVAGFGELIGYSLRLVSGYLADKTQRYWTITIIGYLFNLIPVPLLALAGNWEIAALLIVLERFGKAIRTPPRDAMLSYAGHKVGVGWAFGLHEALDRAGATIGPLVIALLMLESFSYQFAFTVLAFPAALALLSVFVTCKLYQSPKSLENNIQTITIQGIKPIFWLYLLASGLLAAGFVDFSLIAYHLSKTKIFSNAMIPFSYALAMGVSAVTAPLFGYLYDRFGLMVLLLLLIVVVFFAPLIFLTHNWLCILGVVIWGVGVAANEALMRAIVANMVSINHRASAYGIFNLVYGIAWFIGSVILGVLYDINVLLLVAFAVIVQVAALPILFLVLRKDVGHP